jgi:hypothetical protein
MPQTVPGKIASDQHPTPQHGATMKVENRELNGEEMGTVTGGGLVDTVLSDAETSTNEFSKRSVQSPRFNAFMNAPTASQVPIATQ